MRTKKRKCIEGETKIDNVMCKESSATQSDSRNLGDELNYNLDYEYAKGYAHRVSRIGTRYYQYDENGNLTVEQEWPFNNGETGADGERSGKFSTRSNGGSATETLCFNRMWTWRYDGLLSDRTGQNSKHIYLGGPILVTKTGS
ncbi:MAG: hypothetical protein LBR68_04135 [Lachnoclostridium sp.]|nr:hypothetical protein [Lachnoclostridium sp.]